VLKTSSRKLKIKVQSYLELLDWIQALITSVDRSLYCRPNRYGSFCPISSGNFAKSYIGADQYYLDLANELDKATHEIYITDWWMSPEVHLRRPIKRMVKNEDVNGNVIDVDDINNYDNHSRLDQILKRAAARGCKVFILLYKEFDGALPNNSEYTRDKLKFLFKEPENTEFNKNIEVVRHPGDLIFLWSHHEKIVVIDQKVVFLGGLDLCYGRFDLPEYPLFEPLEKLAEDECYFLGQDYSNVRVKDFNKVGQIFVPLINKKEVPRMPWRDIAMQLRGPVTKDVTRHFIQYWNFAKSDIEGKGKGNFLMKKDFDSGETKKKNKKSKFEVVSFKKKNKVEPKSSDNEENRRPVSTSREQSVEYLKEEDQPLVQFKLR
jgi:phospholipase D1/2